MKIGDILKIKHGKDYKSEDNFKKLYPVLGTGGIITYIDNYLCNWNCVCIGRKGTINKPIFMNIPFWSVDTLFYTKPILNNNPKFQFYLFETINWLSYNAATGLPSLSASIIENIKKNIPNIEEQNKIADFLSLVDKRIEKQRQLVENLKKYKRGLLSAIFERKIRFKDDNGNDYLEWNKIPLGSIFVERVEKATGNEELLSVTINEGIKKRNTIDIKDNSSEDKSHYKKVYKDDIAYNTMRMWQGASGVSKYKGMVSPAYTVISPKIDVNIDFWSYYLKYYKIIHLFQKFSQGLTSDTWNLKFPQFAEIKVLVPSKVEQEKLAEILLTFDNNINIYQNYLDKLEQLKKSLLQQMFI